MIEELCEFSMLMPPEADDELVRDIEGLLNILSPLDSVSTAEAITECEEDTVMREDIALPYCEAESFLSSAPEHTDGYIRVPRTVELGNQNGIYIYDIKRVVSAHP